MAALSADPSASAKILAAIRAVPRGTVAGYGHIARRAGLPGRARMVARLLAGNEDPTLPWHRIVRSDGRIAFPAGSAEFDEQVQRLRAEGRGRPGCGAVGAGSRLKPPAGRSVPRAVDRAGVAAPV